MKTLLSLLFVLGFVSVNAQVFNDSPMDSIPDDGTTECYDITVAGVGNIDDTYGLASICLNINHDWVGELEITLTSPNGTTFNVTEVDFGIWGAPGFVNTCFQQDAGQVLDGGTAPYTGSFLPSGTMYAVNDGQNADGVWQLCINDAFTSERGFLESWSIEFNNNPAVQPPLGNQDCAAAIPVCNSTFSEVNSYAGTGAITDEIDGLNSCLSGEVNSVWYTFNVESDGQVNFTITPNDLTDDYDWAIYDISTANCSDIYTDPSLEVSCNFSGVSGITGANGGTGAQEEPLLNALQGQVYAVVISNWSGSTNGYTLDFTQSTSQIYDTVEPQLDSISTTMTCGMDSLTFTFSENVICSTVTHHDLTLTGPGGPYTISNIRGDACQQGGSYERAYTMDISPPLTLNGTYTLSVTPGAAVEDNCGNLIDVTGSIDFGLVPMNVTKDSTMVTCFGDNDGSATITGASGQAPLSYVWDDPLTQSGATASALAPGIYNVTVTDAVGCVQTESVEITEPTQLTVTAPDAAQSCFGVCDATSTAIALGGTSSGSYTYAWNDSGFTLAATVSSLCAGSYQVTVTDDNLCAANHTINITEPASMVIDTTLTQSTCNQATGEIQLTMSGGTSPYNYQWTDGTGASIGTNSDNLTGLVSDTYGVTVTDASGCTIAETIPITSLFEHTISATLVSGVSCFGDCDGEVTTSITGFGSTFTYTWIDQTTGVDLGITADNANTLCAGIYEVTSIESTTGCFDTAVITVSSPAQMQMTTSADTTICENGCANLEVSTAGGALPITHIWTVDFSSYDLGQTVTYCPNTQTTYYVIASDANSCLEIDSVTVSLHNPLAVAISANSSSICEGDSVVLTAIPAGGLAPYTYDWNGTPTSSNQFIAYPSTSSTFSVSMTDNCESNSTSDNINITVNTVPQLNLAAHDEGCSPHAMKFTSNVLPAPASYTIRFGDGIDTSFASFNDTISHLYTDPGFYDVYMNILTTEGCLTDTIFEDLLQVHENPIASFYVSEDTVSDVFRQICFYDQSSNGDILEWVIDDSSHLSTDDITCYEGQGIGCYNATLYTSNTLGCIDSLTRQVCIEEQSSLFVPSAFTPNDDSYNTCFRPIVRGSISGTYVLQIFDRWGNLIHESKSIDDCWDGRINSNPPVTGVYIYKLWYTDNQGELIKKIGHLTVLP